MRITWDILTYSPYQLVSRLFESFLPSLFNYSQFMFVMFPWIGVRHFFQCMYAWFSCIWTSAAGNVCRGIIFDLGSRIGKEWYFIIFFIPYIPLEWCIHPQFSYILWFSCSGYMFPVPYILLAMLPSSPSFPSVVPDSCQEGERLYPSFPEVPKVPKGSVQQEDTPGQIIATSYDPGLNRDLVCRRVSSAFKMNAGSCRWD